MTPQAFDYRGIPIPAVKNMVRGICKGLEFLHRKCRIIHTDLKPENILLHFSPNLCHEADNSVLSAGSSVTPSSSQTAISVKELERALENQNLTPDERRRLRNRLKKKRQKERKTDDRLKNVDECVEQISNHDVILSSVENELNESRDHASNPSPEKVLERLSHSAFVANNFSAERYVPTKWNKVVNDAVVKPTLKDTSLVKGEDTAKLTFLLRAFGPEGEVADNISNVLKLKWEKVTNKRISRLW